MIITKTISIYNFILDKFSKLHMKPSFIIIGTQKGGTTSLFHYLSQHPNVIPPRKLVFKKKIIPYISKKKELHYFDRDKLNHNYFYKRNFPSILRKLLNRQLITGEATPAYLFFPKAPKEIKKYYPKTKFIILLRDPIKRAYSSYEMQKRKGIETKSFQYAIQNEIKRKKQLRKKYKGNPYSLRLSYRLSYKKRSIYSKQLKKWFKYFNKKQFLILESEEFHKNTDKIFKEICHFLNIPYKRVNYNLKNVGHYKSSIPSEIKTELKRYFKPYNEELKQLIGKEFSWMKNYD